MTPVIKKTRRVSPVWILPIVAAVVCILLLYSSYKNAGVTVELFLKSATGITAGKTKVMLRGIPIGVVEKISPDLKQERVRATMRLDAQVEEMLVEDTVFWVVRPQLSASSITGLETIVSGSYVNVQPGLSTTKRYEFVAAEEQPPPPEDTPGLHLVLTAADLGSLQVGSGIYYKNIQIGKVEQIRLLKKENKVELKVLIDPVYASMVREGSRFYKASGVQIKGSLSSVSLKIASLAALLRGGIELFTPEQLENTLPAKNQAAYPLYADFDEAEYGLPLILHLNSSKGIVEGTTKLIYRGLVVGVVKKLDMDISKRNSVTARIQLDPRASEILREGTEFWMVKPSLSPAGVENLDLLIGGAYISFRPGKGEFKNEFVLLPLAPSELPSRRGELFHLASQRRIKVSDGSPVYFKNIQIGETVSVDIDQNGTELLIDIYVYQEYLHLITEDSLFWEESGVKINASLASGLSLESGPFSSMFFGGIGVYAGQGEAPAAGKIFPLYPSEGEAMAATPSLKVAGKSIRLTADDAGSLIVGAPVLFRNIQIGEIQGLNLRGKKAVEIDVLVYQKYQELVTARSRFYRNSGFKIRAGLDGVDIEAGSFRAIAAGGISCVNISGDIDNPESGSGKLYGSLDEAQAGEKFTVKIRLSKTAGIKKGTVLLYKGVSVGEVSGLGFSEGLEQVVATAQIDHKARSLFCKGTQIWAEQPQIGFGGVKHADALIFGPALALLPGDGPLDDDFLLLEKPPLGEIANASGMGIVLETTNLGSVSVGSPVYYRQVQVGSVTGYQLSPSFQKVQIFVSIKHRFRPLIRINTRFWNVSGIEIRGGFFSGVAMNMNSLESLVKGGIAFATPDTVNLARAAEPGQHFILHKKPEREWLDWQPDVKILEKEDAGKFLQMQKQFEMQR